MLKKAAPGGKLLLTCAGKGKDVVLEALEGIGFQNVQVTRVPKEMQWTYWGKKLAKKHEIYLIRAQKPLA